MITQSRSDAQKLREYIQDIHYRLKDWSDIKVPLLTRDIKTTALSRYLRDLASLTSHSRVAFHGLQDNLQLPGRCRLD